MAPMLRPAPARTAGVRWCAVRVVLASASPARLAVLRAAGISPEVIVSGVDEDVYTAPSTGELTQVLASAKAATAAEAEQRWRRMSGRTGTLFTGHCVIDVAGGRQQTAVAATTVRFGMPT